MSSAVEPGWLAIGLAAGLTGLGPAERGGERREEVRLRAGGPGLGAQDGIARPEVEIAARRGLVRQVVVDRHAPSLPIPC